MKDSVNLREFQINEALPDPTWLPPKPPTCADL